MTVSNEDVINAFLGSGEDIRSLTLILEDGVLYSYGKHWPIAVWNAGTVYVNKERRSATSSKHYDLITQASVSAGKKTSVITLNMLTEMIRNRQSDTPTPPDSVIVYKDWEPSEKNIQDLPKPLREYIESLDNERAQLAEANRALVLQKEEKENEGTDPSGNTPRTP